MSYITKQRNDAVIVIGECSPADINPSLYTDLEKFYRIKHSKENGQFAGAILTFSGSEKDLLRRLKKSDDYTTIIQKDFSKLFNDTNFQFQRIYYIDKELYYYVNFNNNGHRTEFSMHKEEENMWVIENKMLPEWVHELEMEFSEAIISNEQTTKT